MKWTSEVLKVLTEIKRMTLKLCTKYNAQNDVNRKPKLNQLRNYTKEVLEQRYISELIFLTQVAPWMCEDQGNTCLVQVHKQGGSASGSCTGFQMVVPGPYSAHLRDTRMTNIG